MSLKYQILKAKTQVDKKLILLHGYGSNGNSMLTVAAELQQHIPNITFIAPNAPTLYEGGSYGMPGYQWFSLLDRSPEKMLSGVVAAQQVIAPFIEEVIDQDPHIPVFVLGFSQGAMLAAHTVLRLPRKIKGLVMCSGALIAPGLLDQEIAEVAKDCTILLTHGKTDQVVPAAMSEEAHNKFVSLKLKSQLVMEAGVDHAISYVAFGAIRKFLSF